MDPFKREPFLNPVICRTFRGRIGSDKSFCRINKRAVTLRAWSLACSSSKASCFSFSSILLKDMPVEDRELTALDRVDALQRRTHKFPFRSQFLGESRKALG